MTATNSNHSFKLQKEEEANNKTEHNLPKKVNNFEFSYLMLACIVVFVLIGLSLKEMYDN